MNRLPNFLIIGAQKSGTTSLYEYLCQHPQVYMSPIKEPHFFTYEGESHLSNKIITDWERYIALFSMAKPHHVAIGEASPSYLHAQNAPERIARYLPDVRLIAILRNPIDRAFSNWLHNVRNGREKLSFREALAKEEERMRQGIGYAFYYKFKGFYYQHLSRYIHKFPREHIRVYLFEELSSNPMELLKDIFVFLDIDTSVQINIQQHNVSGIPRGFLGGIFNYIRKLKAIQKLGKQFVSERLRRRIRSKVLEKPVLENELRKYLIELYREDIIKLEHLLGRDLSNWLQ